MMDDVIKALAIAPYEGMAGLLETVAKEFPAIDLSIHIGDLDSGVEVAKSAFQSNFDLIFSRGGTAKRLRQAFSIPVVEIGVSCYDILHTLKLANINSGRVAMVGFYNIFEEISALRELLQVQFDVYPIASAEEAKTVLESIAYKNYTALLCDVISHTTARKMGLSSFLISSGTESIRAAMQLAMAICEANRTLRLQNKFLQDLLEGHSGETVVFDPDGKLIYSTLDPGKVELLDYLRDRIPEVESKESKLVFQFRNTYYRAKTRWISFSGSIFIVFHVTASTQCMYPKRIGIRFDNRRQVEEEYLHGMYRFVVFDQPTRRFISKLAENPCPVLIMGEVGTGKGQAARMIYLNGKLRNHPFIEIDCQSIQEKDWNYLISSHDSPLFDIGNTLYIKNVEAISAEQLQTLVTILATGYASRQNYTILSVSTTLTPNAGAIASAFLNRLECQSLLLPPLRENKGLIEQLVYMYINHFNLLTGKHVSKIAPEAMQMLCNFLWPQNYIQLNRVVERLITTAEGHMITERDTEEILKQELFMLNMDANARSSIVLNISRPLSEINREIAQLVLDANGGNRTKTAKSLGISRATLWRLLKRDKDSE
jgi:Sigma-54 interaction domain./Bacterial regulatory protein, Fis family./Propionate catabolism activator.